MSGCVSVCGREREREWVREREWEREREVERLWGCFLSSYKYVTHVSEQVPCSKSIQLLCARRKRLRRRRRRRRFDAFVFDDIVKTGTTTRTNFLTRLRMAFNYNSSISTSPAYYLFAMSKMNCPLLNAWWQSYTVRPGRNFNPQLRIFKNKKNTTLLLNFDKKSTQVNRCERPDACCSCFNYLTGQDNWLRQQPKLSLTGTFLVHCHCLRNPSGWVCLCQVFVPFHSLQTDLTKQVRDFGNHLN